MKHVVLIIAAAILILSCGQNNTTKEVSKNEDIVKNPEIESKANDSNRKLKQENAENTVRKFLKNHTLDLSRGEGKCIVDENAITIDPINQFSETSVDLIVKPTCTTNIEFTFNFQKDIDNKWILVKIVRKGYSNYITQTFIIPNQNINMVAQE